MVFYGPVWTHNIVLNAWTALRKQVRDCSEFIIARMVVNALGRAVRMHHNQA